MYRDVHFFQNISDLNNEILYDFSGVQREWGRGGGRGHPQELSICVMPWWLVGEKPLYDLSVDS